MHTPGPWRENGQTVFDKAGNEICTCGHYVEDGHAANAHLIAAAPDMLEALKRCVRMLSWSDSPLAREVSEHASRTIAKATGKGKA